MGRGITLLQRFAQLSAWQKISVCLAAVVVLLGAWMLRFDLQVGGSGGGAPIAYLLDRWTGTVYVITPAYKREVKADR